VSLGVWSEQLRIWPSRDSWWTPEIQAHVGGEKSWRRRIVMCNRKAPTSSLSYYLPTLIANEHEASLQESRRCLDTYSILPRVDLNYPCFVQSFVLHERSEARFLSSRRGTQKGLSQSLLVPLLFSLSWSFS
jgi:hypothetical protein